MLRCSQFHLCDADLEGMTMGMVFDMMIEDGNDHEEWPEKATQSDIDRFF